MSHPFFHLKWMGHKKIGAKWFLNVSWEDDTNTWEPLKALAIKGPVTIVRYAQENGLLDVPAFKRFKSYVKREKRFIRMLRQAQLRKIRQRKAGPKYQFGIRVPRHYKEAILLDKQNGNTFWQDTIKKELDQIREYETFMPRPDLKVPPKGH